MFPNRFETLPSDNQIHRSDFWGGATTPRAINGVMEPLLSWARTLLKGLTPFKPKGGVQQSITVPEQFPALQWNSDNK